MELKTFLESKYDSASFESFITERFYGFEASESDYDDSDLSNSEKNHIESYRYLGQVELDDGKEVGFFEFLSTSPNIENKRVGYNAILKKFAADYLLDGAIASFYHPKSNAWRLSFVGFEYDGSKENVTNLKRYTYVLGDDVPHKTAYIQLKKLKYPNFDEVEEAFGVEKVSQEFYEKYKELFETLNDYLKDGQYNYFNQKESELHSFTKKLLGRIVFLYFLQKKGWLGVGLEHEWGAGDKKFLSNALKSRKYNNFFDDFLKKIFFEALNSKQEDDYFELTGNRIPFLNGGLFEKDKYDKIEELYLENKLFEKIFRTFNEYNFTIIEDSPDDKEVAIDPEMMGRVFENLLEENYRKGKGAFYTPREVVHYMCQQAIINYLTTYFPDKEKIVDLVVNRTTDNNYFLQYGEEIKNKLLQMKILDPAIGSGAFPMGMLHEIVTVLANLDKTQSADEIAKMKRTVIENSIYGVDIDASAVEVAKLRFWLSLVVDEEIPTPLPNLYYKIMVGNSLLETINGFDPLSKDTSTLFDESEDKIKQIQELLHRFYKSNEHQEKATLKTEIETSIDIILNKKIEEQKTNIQTELSHRNVLSSISKSLERQIGDAHEMLVLLEKIKHRPTTELFFYKIYFAEVLEQGGFDIVIGNPPYIRQEKIKELKPRLENEKFYNPITQKYEQYECFNGTADIYIYFFEKGFRLLKDQGTLSYITSNKYTRAKYGQKFRKFVLENAQIVEYVDFNGVKVFESATVDTSILTYKKAKASQNQFIYCDVDKSYNKGEDLAVYVAKNGFNYPQSDLSEESFSFANPKELVIKKRIEEVGTQLKKWDEVNIFRGISTGYNDAFVLEEKTKNKLITCSKLSNQHIKKLLSGKEIRRFVPKTPVKNILFITWDFDIEENQCIKSYLEQFKDNLSKRPEVNDGRYAWYALSRYNSNSYMEFEKEKIVWQRVTKEPTFCLVEEGVYILDSMAFITSKINQYLTSLLNSKVIHFYIDKITHQYGKTGYLLSNQYVEYLPIKKVSSELQLLFKTLVEIIIHLKSKEDLKSIFFERIVDVMVYELYFEKELHEKGFGILDVVSKDLALGLGVDELYKRWRNSKHPVKYNVDFIDSVEVVKTIEESL